MSVYIEDFPFCCTAKVLCGFGGTDTAEEICDGGSFHSLIEEIKGAVDDAWNLEDEAIIVATTNQDQKVANKVLKKLGFKGTKYTHKDRHPETKVKLWHIDIQTLLSNLNKV